MVNPSLVDPDRFIEIPVAVFEKLSGYHALVALYLAIKRYHQLGTASPTNRQLSLMLGVSQRSIIRWKQQLVDLDVLAVER